MPLTHADLCAAAAIWCQNNFDCHDRLLIEPQRRFALVGAEVPDCICWRDAADSVIVECKISESDYRADQKKISRKQVHKGMGRYRYYLTPEYLIEPHQVSAPWGLLYLTDEGVRMVKEAEPVHQRNVAAELALSLYGWSVPGRENGGAKLSIGQASGARRGKMNAPMSAKKKPDPICDECVKLVEQYGKCSLGFMAKVLDQDIKPGALKKLLKHETRLKPQGETGVYELADTLKLVG